MAFEPISHASTEYVRVVVRAKREGSSLDVSVDTVEMAFVLDDGSSIDDADWNVGLWETNALVDPPIYTALCLIGPDAVELAVGEYIVYVRVTDNPEEPVLRVPGILPIT